jgi:hypothetical protein
MSALSPFRNAHCIRRQLRASLFERLTQPVDVILPISPMIRQGSVPSVLQWRNLTLATAQHRIWSGRFSAHRLLQSGKLAAYITCTAAMRDDMRSSGERLDQAALNLIYKELALQNQSEYVKAESRQIPMESLLHDSANEEATVFLEGIDKVTNELSSAALTRFLTSLRPPFQFVLLPAECKRLQDWFD